MILVWMITVRLHRQWSAGTSEGVSIWLFFGQGGASVGFLTYSLMLANWVFAVANGRDDEHRVGHHLTRGNQPGPTRTP